MMFSARKLSWLESDENPDPEEFKLTDIVDRVGSIHDDEDQERRFVKRMKEYSSDKELFVTFEYYIHIYVCVCGLLQFDGVLIEL